MHSERYYRLGLAAGWAGRACAPWAPSFAAAYEAGWRDGAWWRDKLPHDSVCVHCGLIGAVRCTGPRQ